ncbi:ABC transporter permease [Ornithinibacillus contaminans]|uniref:ABC transporter permease n=1 Tax=Ornithinibacillus contaminans TaxID=694055 RepID=UPI0009FA32C9|nr:ABC transporter permease [Ornithinibacillus contaminans]
MMQFLRLVAFFCKYYFLQLKRKWLTLPLLLVFPIVLIGMVAFIIISYLSSIEAEPLQLGLVDLDQSTETELIISLLEESSQLSEFIQMTRLTEEEAAQKITTDELIGYIRFPKEFINKLYNGQSVDVTVVGNPKHPMESNFIKELVDSAARHISVSQANIVTINYYAKQLELDTDTRNELMQTQFNDFMLYAIGKDNVLDQQLITNNATASPKEYFALATAFFILTIWIITIYNRLVKEQSPSIETRLTLYGVTELQQIFAKILVSFTLTLLLGSLLFFGIIHVIGLAISPENYWNMITLLAIYNVTFLFVLAVIEQLIRSLKVRLLIQMLITAFILLASGSFIPTIYFPLYLQNASTRVFSSSVFHSLEDILLNGRFYVEYLPVVVSAVLCLLLVIGIAWWKERVRT